ncbi:MAG: hypothetical protein ACOYXB_11270 [Bacteroidota bacterium]
MNEWASTGPLLLISLLLFLLAFFITGGRRIPLTVLSVFLIPAIPLTFGLSGPSLLLSLSMLLLLWFMWGNGRSGRILPTGQEGEIRLWRIIARPFALLFIPVKEGMGEGVVLTLTGVLALVFIGLDLYRLFGGVHWKKIFKSSEARKFSSMTSFLVAVFLLFLLFPDPVTYLCLVFILFGDLCAKFSGRLFGGRKVVGERTLRGSAGFLAGSLFAGYFVCLFTGTGTACLIAGALMATLAELFSFDLDDNFTVGILCGGGLTALHYFHLLC